MTPRLVAVLLLAATLLAACGTPVALRTQPAPISACDDALASGILVPSPASGLGLQLGDGSVQPVEWPFQYTARREATGLVLVDPAGAVVAREGQLIQVGGGSDGQGVFKACPGSIMEVPAQG